MADRKKKFIKASDKPEVKSAVKETNVTKKHRPASEVRKALYGGEEEIVKIRQTV